MNKKGIYSVSVVILVLVVWIFMRPTEENVEQTKGNTHDGLTVYLEDYEFSEICMAWEKIYAVGVEGLFVIDPKANISEKIIGHDMAYVKAVVYDEVLNGLWIGHNKGVTFYDGNEYIDYKSLEELTHTEVNDILLTSKGQMYIGTFDGLYIVEDLEIKTIITDDNGLTNIMVNTLYEDEDGLIWCGAYVSNGGGVTLLQEEKVIHQYEREDGLIHNSITTISETKDHNILVGGGVYTEGGISVFIKEDNIWSIVDSITIEDGLAGEKVRYIYTDDDYIWICSEYDGIAIMTNEFRLITKLTIEDGLSDDETKKIYKDSSSNMWLATRRGITKIDKETKIKLLEGHKDKEGE